MVISTSSRGQRGDRAAVQLAFKESITETSRRLRIYSLTLESKLCAKFKSDDWETLDAIVVAFPDMEEVRFGFQTTKAAEQFRAKELQDMMGRLYRSGTVKLGTLSYSARTAELCTEWNSI